MLFPAALHLAQKWVQFDMGFQSLTVVRLVTLVPTKTALVYGIKFEEKKGNYSTLLGIFEWFLVICDAFLVL